MPSVDVRGSKKTINSDQPKSKACMLSSKDCRSPMAVLKRRVDLYVLVGVLGVFVHFCVLHCFTEKD